MPQGGGGCRPGRGCVVVLVIFVAWRRQKMVTATAVTSCLYLCGEVPSSLVVLTNDLEVLVVCSSLTGINLHCTCEPQLTKSGCKIV